MRLEQCIKKQVFLHAAVANIDAWLAFYPCLSVDLENYARNGYWSC